LELEEVPHPFSIGVMVGNDNYRSALGFNALFFYGRALTVHERTLMIAYSKKEYESIDPVELTSATSSFLTYRNEFTLPATKVEVVRLYLPPPKFEPWSTTILPLLSLIR
jgi:hypothetical protein